MLKKVLISTVMLLTAGLSWAGVDDSSSDYRFYLGGGLGWSYLNPQTEGNSSYEVYNNNGFSLRAYGGYLFLQKYSVELSYATIGTVNVRSEENGISSTKLSYYGGAIDGVFRWWEYDHPYNLFAKAGMSIVRAANTNDDFEVDNVDDALFSFGAGASYRLTRQLQLRADFENYSKDVKALTVGMEWAPTTKTPKALPADSDHDGVIDDLDQCPGSAPNAEVDQHGCVIVHDSDHDGVQDSADQCPATAAGIAVDNQGCALDSDHDGVTDDLDQCPDTAAGIAVDDQGCALDSDHDGVTDGLDQCPDTPADGAVDDSGCSLKPLSILPIESELVQFSPGSSELTPEAKQQLDVIAAYLQQFPTLHINVEAHTDSQGSEASNMTLSQLRAIAVKNYLVEQGIVATRLSTQGFGESLPIADNTTAEGRRQNRRVEFRIIQ